MATTTLRLFSNSSSTITAKKIIPGATAITRVTHPSLTDDQISFSFNKETGEITVTLRNVKSTDSGTTSREVPLSSQSVSGNTRTCYYYVGAGGSMVTTVGATQSCPATRTYTAYWVEYDYTVTIEYSTNTSPSVTLTTANALTLYENDTLNISGSVQDVDSGNTVTVKYSINNSTARTLHTFVSDGSAVSFNKPLTFKRNKLHDGSTAVTGDLQEGVTHTLRVWAEDDQGGKSTVHSRTFNVIPNRPEVKVNGQSRVVETVYCKVNGQAREVVKMWVKVNGELREV